ncbi:secondary thiamine-phosphate synthase enzyme YjbQ [Candidatus Omnitrophota bacterium]
MAHVISKSIQLSTRGNTDIIDITPEVEQRLKETKLKSGMVTISVAGSTASVTTCEYEPGVVADLKRMYEELIPGNRKYAHDDAWGDGNAHSHMRASLTGPSATISFLEGKLSVGTWQQIILIDFDNKPRRRKVLLQFIGE